MTMEEYCKQLEYRVAELEKENAELRAQLGISDTKAAISESLATVQDISAATVNKYSSPHEKIQLFRSLFRSREDVFAKRWYSTKTEKRGYSPACANEWREGVCIKPKGSCSKCENRELVSLSNAIIYEHLSGKDSYGRDVVGLYPILPDDTCYFLAIDFDDGDWQDIIKDVIKALADGRAPIVLTERREHVLLIADRLVGHCKNIITLFGAMSAKFRRETMEKLLAIPADEPLVIIATGKYVGEGFD